MVNFNSGDKWSIGEVEIKEENGKTIFEGKYGINSMLLLDKNGKPVIENITLYTDLGKESPYYEKYQLSLKRIVEFSLLENERVRGEFELLAISILLLLLTIIDVKYPLLFFTLSHYLSVKDPEPTDYYIVMQKISWFVFPIISIIMLIVAI
ncbi:MAG: hypothetical protein PHE29_03930 [Tissierellia bacterium]|nr:hypothetical protein [Tissierellia bacterium]MDD4780296.1 hypothetical protein [Tissierellia bacterium]